MTDTFNPDLSPPFKLTHLKFDFLHAFGFKKHIEHILH